MAVGGFSCIGLQNGLLQVTIYGDVTDVIIKNHSLPESILII